MWKCLTLCIVLTFCRDARGDIGDQMAEVIQKCCDDGSAHARSHSGENCNIPSAPADVPAAFGSLCVMAQAQCCREYYKKKDSCDSGLDLALSTGKCTGSKDYTKVCCDECSQGSAAGLAGGAEACVSKTHANSAESLLADDAFLKCCMKTAKEGAPKITPKPEVTIASVCEDYAPNELCAHHCIPIPGSYKCECNPGFMLMADGRNCREVVKNRCKPRNPCQHKCNDNGIDVLCSCRRGYELMPDGKSCQDIDECQLDIPVCLAGTLCHNVQGSYRCINQKKIIRDQPKGQCPPGFARNLKNNVCDDINECKLPRPPCPTYLCQNTVGGYKCGGVSGDPVNLTPRTSDVEDRCPPGFALGSSGECEDVDECAIMTDDCNRLSQYCVNTHSSFYCQDMVSKLCQPGFKIDAMTNRCEDINECEDHAICKSDQICVNQPGQYVCKQKPPQTRPRNGECPDGMRLDPATHVCDDIDECVEGTHLCDQHQNCHNLVGSYQCDCKLGFELDTTTGACVDVNECATHQHDCMMNSQRCDNTIGSYLCIRITSCGTGYILQHATGKCEDNDECALGTHNCAIAGPEYQCINIPGSFRCVKKRAATTTAAPEYEYEYYDSDEEIDQPSTNKTEPAPNSPSSPGPPPSSTEVPPPDVHKPEEHTPEAPKQEPTPEKPKPEPATDDNQIPTEERKPIDYIPEVPRYIAPLYTSSEPETTSPEPTSPITYSEPDSQNRPDIVYEPNSEPPEKNTPDLTYYETKPDKPISSNEISPTEREPVTEQTPPRRNGSGRTYSPYRPTPRYNDDRHGVNVNVNDCPNGFEVDSNGGCFDIDECASNRHSCSGLTETCRNSVGGYVCDCALGFRRDLFNGACVHVITTSSTTSSAKDLPPPPTLPELPLIPPSPPTLPPTPPTLPPTPPTLPPIPPTSATTPATLPPIPPTMPTEPPTLPPTPPTLPPTPPTLPPTTTPEPVSSTTEKARELFFGYRDDRPQYTRPFRPRSSCDAGFYLNAQTNTCEDINECTNGQANCAVVEICVNTRGGYRCECPPHWRLDDVRHRCVPIRNNGLFPPGYGNEPVYPPTDPQEAVGLGFEKTNFVNPEITQVEDRGAVLKCPWGYRLGDDNTCVDVDECATGEAKCGIQQICSNLAGGYTCSCPRGHRLVGDHECEDVDECALAGNSSICSRNADCVNTIGSYQCKCHTGFRPAPVNDKVCVDVDECSEARTGSLCQHRCNNVWGSYRCSCHRGYRLSSDNRTCVDVDECVQFKSKLPCVGKCLNEPGSYRCACPIGYRLSEDKRSCIDIDECETGEAGCQTGIFGGASHVCSNTRGSYHCQQITCPRGYQLEGKHRCTKTQRVCMVGDWECAHQPTTISYNFITFVSKLFVPEANVKLFTMRGPAWPYTELTFQLRLVNINAPPSVKDRADINAFLLTQTGHEAVISLVHPLEGPQSIELELSMELHNREQFGGIAIAKVFIYVSEYEF